MTLHDDRNVCPSAGVWCGFLEGRIEHGVAIHLTKHLEDCRDCCFIVRETAAFLRENSPTALVPKRSAFRRRWLMAVAAATILFAGLQFFISRDDGRHFDQALAQTPVRPTEGRLSGLPYRGYVARRGERPSVTPRLLALADAVLEEKPRSAPEWHRRGLAYLLKGDASAAVASLARAAELAPRNASYWSDLAAARIGAGSALDEPAMLVRATRDAMYAIQLDPVLREARFNLAVAFERRGLPVQAQATYGDYLSLDQTSPWAMEARTRRLDMRP